MHRKGIKQEGFILDNITAEPKTIELPKGKYTDILTGKPYSAEQELAPYEVRVLQRK
ncbi:MAG: Beta-galactosidase C-terminal domain [bacterium]|nr:Beta-galactosidase C-terminal domain [bacterium]